MGGNPLQQTKLTTGVTVEGRIEVICGGMFAGKTEEFIKRINRARIARRKVQVFKPAIDTRYTDDGVVDHNGNGITAVPVTSAAVLTDLVRQDTDVVGLDEAQFFDATIVDIIDVMANEGKRVIVAGLDQDWRGRPFGPMPELLAVADDVTKLHAICVICGNRASKSFRIVKTQDTVRVGGKDAYEARCRPCYAQAVL